MTSRQIRALRKAGATCTTAVDAQLAAIDAVWALAGPKARLRFVRRLMPSVDRAPPPPLLATGTRTSRAPDTPSKAIADGADLVKLFVAECVVSAPGERVAVSAMHVLFNAFAKARGAEPWSIKRLSLALQFHGFRRLHSDTIWWRDLRLTKTAAGLNVGATGMRDAERRSSMARQRKDRVNDRDRA